MSTDQNNRSSSAVSNDTEALIQPYALHRKSSEARFARLELRKRQSLSGEDVKRLYRAHEAGLVVTPGGSARRSLRIYSGKSMSYCYFYGIGPWTFEKLFVFLV